MSNENNKQIKELESELKEQEDEEKLEAFIKMFDEDFETNRIKYMKETPLLYRICDDFSKEICETTALYQKADKLKSQIKEQLFQTLSDEQRIMIKQIEFCNDTMLEDTEKQAIIYGYAMCSQLRDEAVSKYPLKKKGV